MFLLFNRGGILHIGGHVSYKENRHVGYVEEVERPLQQGG